MRVEVDEPHPPAGGEMPGDGAHAHRAVAAEHQCGLARTDRFLDTHGGLADDLCDHGEVLCAAVVAVGAPAPDGPVSVVVYHCAGVAQRLDEAHVPERARRLLLPGSEGTRARRNADQPQRPAHLAYSTRSGREACSVRISIGTKSSALACVAPSTTSGAQPAL